MRARTFCIVMVALMASPLAAFAKPLAVGKKAPDFSLRDESQALIRFSRVARGNVVVLDFFRTDCAPCRKGLPKLIKLHERFKGKKVKVLVIALLEDEQGEEKLERYFKKHKVPFPVLLDAYGTVAKKYIAQERGSVQLPSLFVVDKTGTVKIRHQTLLSDTKAVAAEIAKLL